jgi:small-conductance mechanosensitive channel
VADFLGKVFEEAGRRIFSEETISFISGAIVKYTVALVSVVMALGLVGLDAFALNIVLAVLLVGAVAVLIIAIREILPDFTAALYLKKQLRRGEFVRVGNNKGVVESVDSISVTLRDGEKRIMIPSSVFVKNPVEKKLKAKR